MANIRSYRRHLLVGCLVFGLFFAMTHVFGQLPDESVLPGADRPSRPTRELPAESVLPPPAFAKREQPEKKQPAAPAVNEAERAESVAEQVLPAQADTRPAEPVESRPLPDESQLPTLAAQTEKIADESRLPLRIEQQDQQNGAADLLNLDASMDQRPWLTLRSKAPVARVRAVAFSTDSKRLFVAGEDKSVMVFRRFEPAGGNVRWGYERTIRWQVQRGRRGRVYALATAPRLLAIAGHGAMGEAGEILLVDPDNDQLRTLLSNPEKGHRERITSLAFAPGADPNGIASMDQSGQLIYWTRDADSGQWQPQQVDFAGDQADRLRPWRILHPIAMLDEERVLAPALEGMTSENRPQWKLLRINVKNSDERRTSIYIKDDYHLDMITSVAASQSGSVFASADGVGNLYVWQDKEGIRRFKLPTTSNHTFVSLDLSRDGRYLVAGTVAGEGGQAAQVQVWDVQELRRPRLIATKTVPDDCFAVAISPDGQFLVTGAGSAVDIAAVADPNRVVAAVRTSLVIPRRVAFSKDEGQPYRIGLGRARSSDGNYPIADVFDTKQLQLERRKQQNADEWLDPAQQRGAWRFTTEDERSPSPQYWLTRSNARQAGIPLDAPRDGYPSCPPCWLAGPDGQPFAVAIGTSAGDIYVFRVAAEGESELIRRFRGHASAVTSVGASADQKYLLSGGLDGTIRVWRFDGKAERNADYRNIDRWGATFAVEDGNLVIAGIRDDGPLYFRGMRKGDTITRLRLPYRDGGKNIIDTLDAPNEMLAKLTTNPPHRLVAFEYRRGRTAKKAFQSFPAWQAVASLLIDSDGEWAYWSPTGYYDASFEGHRLFGWQVNRGPQVPPDFFLAAQLRKALERPAVMSKLLEAGSVDEAFRQAALNAPANSQWALRDQFRMAPRVTILTPNAADEVADATVPVRAAVVIPAGQQLVPPKAFANGVLASGPQRISDAPRPDGNHEYIYEWQARLPADQRIAVQVFAATDSEVAAEDAVRIVQKADRAGGPRRLFIAAAAVDQYSDAQVPRLDASVDNTLAFVRSLGNGSDSLYECRALSILNENVTRAMWRLTMEQYADQLRDNVSPNDLLVVLLSGHGVRDEETGQYYFLSADVRYADIMARRYEQCLSVQDLAVFADVPCRKVVILDTCHSGAIQPLTQRQLKAAIRALQDDMAITVTASEGSQEAVQSRFARRLKQGVDGAADQGAGDADGIVTLTELATYVRRMVTLDSAEDESMQVPIAGPKELLELVEVPLAVVPTGSLRTTGSRTRRLTPRRN